MSRKSSLRAARKRAVRKRSTVKKRAERRRTGQPIQGLRSGLSTPVAVEDPEERAAVELETVQLTAVNRALQVARLGIQNAPNHKALQELARGYKVPKYRTYTSANRDLLIHEILHAAAGTDAILAPSDTAV